MPADRVWQQSEARANFADVVEAALSGETQIIRKRSGEEVVVMSKSVYDRMKPSLKDYLLRSAGVAGSDDDETLEDAIAEVRDTGAMGFAPRPKSGEE